MQIGNLEFAHWLQNPELLASPVIECLKNPNNTTLSDSAYVASIDSSLADTAQFCEAYNIGLDISANAIVLKAKKSSNRYFVMCIVLATTKADVNGFIRKHLGAKSVSFASMEDAVQETKMEFGGIGPIGKPNDWQLLIDSKVLEHDSVIIGSGIRGSKIAVDPKSLLDLPNVEVLENLANAVED
ncbi:MAG: YbaK/EbsC family protein [Acidimicrobiia bacterium]